MDERKTRRRDRLQNLTIALLFVSAALLLYQTRQLYTGEGLSGLFSAPAAEAVPAAELAVLPAPVQLAVTGAYGRFGDLSVVTTEEEFAQPGDLLREALGSAGEPQSCTETDFRTALAGESVYYDFQTVLPLSVIAGLVGGDAPREYSARRLLLASRDGASTLYFSDGERYYGCPVKTAAADLKAVVGGYQPSGAVFAYELEQDSLSPYTLFLTGETPQYPVLTSQDPAGDVNSLLSSLGFNPSTRDRYTESTGTLVIREGERTLRLQPDGTAVYNSGSTAELRLAAPADPALEDVIMGSYQLFSRLTSGSGATLCLQSVIRQDGDWVLRFDYQYDGLLIRRSAGGSALTVRLQGRNIAWFSLYLRTYTASEETSHLLPLTQALAIAERYEDVELNIRYTDAGTSPVSTCWLAEPTFA